MRPYATEVARSVVCLCLCVSVYARCTETAELIDMPFGGLTHVVSSNHVFDGSPYPHEKGHFWGGYVLADCNVSTHRCIHCALIACHRRRRTNAFAICTARSEKTVMWPLAKLPWTFVNVKRYYNQYVLIITSAQINLAKGSIAVLSPIAASNAFVRRVQAHSYDTWDICSNRPHLCIACRRCLIIYARWFTPKWGVLIKGQIVRPFTFS